MIEPATSPHDPARRSSLRRELVATLRRAVAPADGDPDAGLVAALRRADPEAPPGAFYRLAGPLLDELGGESGLARDEVERRWVVIAAAMATAQRFLGEARLGAALAAAKVAEMRVLRLLEATPAQLPALVRTVIHQLVQRGESFDPNDLADLVLAHEDDRRVRRAIARDFYRHAAEA